MPRGVREADPQTRKTKFGPTFYVFYLLWRVRSSLHQVLSFKSYAYITKRRTNITLREKYFRASLHLHVINNSKSLWLSQPLIFHNFVKAALAAVHMSKCSERRLVELARYVSDLSNFLNGVLVEANHTNEQRLVWLQD